MGEWISLDTPTGPIRGWRADPAIPPHGALVVVQEIFGVNGHIRDICNDLAAHGYVVIAPAFFDHFEHDVELAYDSEGVRKGIGLTKRLNFDVALQDIECAAKVLEPSGKVGVVGYCWGGTAAYLANTRLSLPAVSYYGARTVPFLSEALRAPMMFHFGERDTSISAADIVEHQQRQPDAETFIYPAGHGFNCNQRHDFDPASAALARERTLGFFQRCLHANQ